MKKEKSKSAEKIIIDAKATIPSDTLLSVCKPLILFSSRTQSEMCMYVKFIIGDSVTLETASEDGVAHAYFKEFKSEGEGEIVVLAKPFFDAIKCSSGDVSLIIKKNSDMNVLTIKFGKTVYRFSGASIENFDDAVNISLESKKYHTFHTERLKYKVGCISHALAKDDNIPALQNIYIDKDRLIAADSIICATTKYPGISLLDGNVFNQFFVDLLGQISSESCEKIGLMFDEGKLYGKTSSEGFDILFLLSTQSEEYPISKVKTVIDKYDSAKKAAVVSLVFPPANAVSALNRVSPLIDKEEPHVIMEVREDNILFSVDNNNKYGEESIYVTHNITPKESYIVAIDIKLLLKAFKVLNGDCYFFSDAEAGIQYFSDSDTIVLFYGA